MNKIGFIANVRHIAWVSFQIAAGQEYNEEINEDQLKSLENGIEFVLKHPYVTPRENHENWMKMKKTQGWVYGDTKDFENNTHPDLVPFDELPEIEKRKDISDIIVHKLGIELWNSIHGK